MDPGRREVDAVRKEGDTVRKEGDAIRKEADAVGIEADINTQTTTITMQPHYQLLKRFVVSLLI